MGIQTVKRSIRNTVAVYEKLLANVSEETFQETPPNGGWSYAEVFSHIFSSNMSCLTAIEKCVAGTAIENNDSMPFSYRLVFFFGQLPPGSKFKVPDKLKDQVRKIDRGEAHTLVNNFLEKLESVAPTIPAASSTQRLKHPRLGMLNARKWLRFIDIHTRHHNKQLQRIAASFAKG
jgi:hypothetical protein